MAWYKNCKVCGARFLRKRNPCQQYCSKKTCQQTRKRIWKREKMKHDLDYKTNQQAANKRWQMKHSDYWQHYRLTHPDYVKRNREAQKVRDGTSLMNASHLAKSDALYPTTLVPPGQYWLSAIEPNLAKSDAFLVEIAVCISPERQNVQSCKESTL